MDNHTIHSNFDDLAIRYLANEASSDEKEELLSILQQSDDKKLQFQELKTAYQKAGEKEIADTFDTEEAFDRFSEIVDKQKPNNAVRFMYAVIALAACLVIGITAWFANRELNTNEILLSSADIIQEVTLSEGSEISLNKNSTLSYPETFDSDKRKVILHGEAFFSITPDKQHPFVVETNNTLVTVLGTSFNILETDSSTTVTVSTGRVEVFAKNKNSKTIITAGQFCTVLTSQETIIHGSNKNSNVLSWKTNILTFDGENLDDVIKTISKQFDTKIELDNNAIRNCQLTATFNNKSLQTIIKALEKTFNLKMEHADDTIFLTGNGC